MKAKRVNFYATSHDLHEILREAQIKNELFGLRAGSHSSNEVQITRHLREIKGFNDPCPADSAQAPRYLVWMESCNISYRKLETASGEVRYIADTTNNPDAILLQPGGRYAPQILIAGELSSTSEAKAAKTLFAHIKKIIEANFKKIKSYYIGPEAMQILAKGGRLTSSAKAPQEYDLAKPS